jgi:glycosyltransferase involved in cell wall biosynthesis
VIEDTSMLDEKLFDYNLPLSALSICVTSYNKSKHLDRALSQLEKLRDLGAEIVIVDDGSTDESPDLLNHYAKGRKAVELHLQSNKGSANARNRAMHFATRAMFFFFDIDDSIDIDVLVKNVIRLKQLEFNLIMMNYLFIHENRIGSDFNESGELVDIDFKNNRTSLMDTMGYWRILYTKVYIKEFNLKFTPTFSDLQGRRFIYDDFFWLLHLYSHDSQIKISPNNEVVYFYNNVANQTPEAWKSYRHQATLMPLAIEHFFKELVFCDHLHDQKWIAKTCLDSLYFHYANFTLSNLPRALASLFRVVFNPEFSINLGINPKSRIRLTFFLLFMTTRNSLALLVNHFPAWTRLDRGIKSILGLKRKNLFKAM